MGKVTGFLEFHREVPPRRPVEERLRDWRAVDGPLASDALRRQGARCMDCGVPFCHTGCPLNNLIPDWNDLVYRDRWREALRSLHATNNFPEFTGALCPAPCETACVLGVIEPPVTIKQIEKAIVARGWEEGWIQPEIPELETGKTVAIVGSGPSGLACAQQLRRAGHSVTVFEKSDRLGGLLRYGIPSFKLEKHILDRRLGQLSAEGVRWRTGVEVGRDVTLSALRRDFDAVVLAGGAENPRDLTVPGRETPGVHFAMEFLTQANRVCEGDLEVPTISAEGKRVVIVGGGDTGADCLGTSLRQGAKSVVQLELLPMPPAERSPATPWPLWPLMLRTESSHEEGGERRWSLATKRFVTEAGRLVGLETVEVGPPPEFAPRAGSETLLEADLVLLAMGFVGPKTTPLLDELELELDGRGNVAVGEDWQTSELGVFATGDMRRGQSLIVWAIAEGRKAAAAVDAALRSGG